MRMEAKNLADLYNLPTLEWAPIEQRIEQGLTQAPGTGGPDRHTTWLATINPDGSPHVTGIGGFWHDGTFWFVTSERSRKGRNVSRDPRCSVSLSTHEFDLTFEGEAHKVTDPDAVAAIAAIAVEDWPASVDDSGIALTAEYSAPSAGPPPWHVYRITPRRATALATVGQGGATTWTF